MSLKATWGIATVTRRDMPVESMGCGSEYICQCSIQFLAVMASEACATDAGLPPIQVLVRDGEVSDFLSTCLRAGVCLRVPGHGDKCRDGGMLCGEVQSKAESTNVACSTE